MLKYVMVLLGIVLGILALLLFYILVLIISSLVIDTSKFYDKNSRYYRWLLNSSTFLICIFGRIHLHVTGMEKVPQGTRFVIVGNHLSNFDPILAWYVFRKYDIAYLSKIENFHVPFYGRIIRKCCFRAIDRENPKNALKTIHEAAELIKADEVSIGIYPEGTRGPGDKLLPFHDGVFHAARIARVPIVVLAVKNTRDSAKNFPLHKTDVFMDVVDVLPAKFVTENRTSVMGARIRKVLNEHLGYCPEQ